jgi:hypothetical protein
MKAKAIVEWLHLEPLAGEGGYYRQTYRDSHSTAIYFLVRPDDPSHLHRLAGPEIYHFYLGAPLQMLLLHPDGAVSRPVLGIDLARGAQPQIAVPGGVWQGSETTGDFTLVGTTMAPGFRSTDFELGDRGRLTELYPGATDAIHRLTRSSGADE